jgi:NADH-quinone oxidoreductase subunit N
MNGTDLIALLPIIVIGAASILVMMGVAVRRSHRLAYTLTLVGISFSIGSLFVSASVGSQQVTPLLTIDPYALFYMGLIFVTTFGVAMLSHGYLEGRAGYNEEFYVLLLLATFGSSVLVASSHFASFFLGLEILSVSLFALIAYPTRGNIPLEGSIKYLIVAGVSTAFMLFGMALVYAHLGTMEFGKMAAAMAAKNFQPTPYWLMGVVMVLTGIGFKLALVPFHMWTPDVYEGAPAPVTAYVATVSKGAMFALLLRYFIEADGYRYHSIFIVLGFIAFASMLVGNILALLQNNVKRILAYSSIAHLGYLLVAFLATGPLAVEAVTFYLVFYFITMLGSFAVVSQLSDSDQDRDTDDLEQYRGLFWRHPWIAATFTGMLFSLAGIPLTIGFLGKFYVVLAAVGAQLWPLVFTLVVGSGIGLYYYLRIIVYMFRPMETEETNGASARPYRPAGTFGGGLVLTATALLLVWLGVYPTPLIHMIETTVLALG